MGADLYIIKQQMAMDAPAFERSAEAVDMGYFRDAYNDGSILRQFGLSWWKDVGPLVNRNGVIPATKVKRLLGMLDMEKFERNIQIRYADDQKYFREGAELLVKFLTLSIAKKSGIEASL